MLAFLTSADCAPAYLAAALWGLLGFGLGVVLGIRFERNRTDSDGSNEP